MSHPTILAVAAAFDVTPEAILHGGNKRRLARPRQAACWLLRTIPPPGGRERSFPEIARIVGYKEHSAVLHGYRLVENVLLPRDAAFVERLATAAHYIATHVPPPPAPGMVIDPAPEPEPIPHGRGYRVGPDAYNQRERFSRREVVRASQGLLAALRREHPARCGA